MAINKCKSRLMFPAPFQRQGHFD